MALGGIPACVLFLIFISSFAEGGGGEGGEEGGGCVSTETNYRLRLFAIESMYIDVS